VRVILRAHMRRAPFERVLGALEIGGCGVSTSVAAFMIGLDQTPLLIAIYSVTVVVAYALVGCLEGPALPQAGND
jgi:hypothetical protein